MFARENARLNTTHPGAEPTLFNHLLHFTRSESYCIRGGMVRTVHYR